MTLAVGHRQDDVAIIDATRERKPPFPPEDVVAEFAALLKSYRNPESYRRPLWRRVAARALPRARHHV